MPRGADAVFLAVIAALLLFPCVFSETRESPAWPRVVGGDEPHYLVLIDSFLEDGDFDLKNNYLEVHMGGQQAGLRFAGSSVDHHTSWYVNGERRVWAELFWPNVFDWPRDGAGRPMAQVRPGVDPRIAEGPEAPAHPVGIALLLAPVLYPFKGGSGLLEPLAILFAALATVGALLFTWRLLRQLTDDAGAVRLALVALFLGSPLWYYARSFFNEPFLLFLLAGAFATALRPKLAWLTGLFIALAMLMKPQSVLLLAPLALPALRERKWGSIVMLGLLPFLAGLLQLWLNARLYGSPALGPYPFYKGDFWTGARGLWLHPRRGMLVYAPWLLFAVAGWPALVRRKPWESAMLLSGFFCVFILTSIWLYWDGGWCYGPRLLVPVLPLLGVGVIGALESPLLQRFAPRWLFMNLVLFAALTNGFAVMRYGHSIDQPVVQMVFGTLGLL
ncbi:hypothetical protein [Hyalangium rubrum]|uniref:Glycosyltransferase RgtA/B/C/D-like domain-containing protein n=1 Tax=Hyalangium rubrum TaxID=3103134 RepID=A0ABU5HIY5_9BACT|nr:hypothetical protein [Hyalangium sp. s54d21]MDY7232045.1 hypothetical protein [Hyalangium sp. s54d21]